MSYDPDRTCEQCGDSSPWVELCGGCEMYSRGYEHGAENDRRDVVKRLRAVAHGLQLLRSLEAGFAAKVLLDEADAIEHGEHIED